MDTDINRLIRAGNYEDIEIYSQKLLHLAQCTELKLHELKAGVGPPKPMQYRILHERLNRFNEERHQAIYWMARNQHRRNNGAVYQGVRCLVSLVAEYRDLYYIVNSGECITDGLEILVAVRERLFKQIDDMRNSNNS